MAFSLQKNTCSKNFWMFTFGSASKCWHNFKKANICNSTVNRVLVLVTGEQTAVMGVCMRYGGAYWNQPALPEDSWYPPMGVVASVYRATLAPVAGWVIMAGTSLYSQHCLHSPTCSWVFNLLHTLGQFYNLPQRWGLHPSVNWFLTGELNSSGIVELTTSFERILQNHTCERNDHNSHC